MPRSADRMRFGGAMVVALVAALIFHVLLGWPFAVLGGFVGGWIAGGRGALAGSFAVAGAWTILAIWSRSVDPRAVDEMARVVGSLLGGLPGVTTYLVTVILGAVLGAVGGWLGQSTRNLLWAVRR